MGVLALCEDSPTFHTDTELSAALIDVIRVNIEALHLASYLGRYAFEWSFQERPENTRINPVTVWRGAFRYLANMTTLTIEVTNASLTTGDVLYVYLNGSGTATTLAAGAQTITRTISGLGYADGEVVELDLVLYNASRSVDDTTWGTTAIRDITLTPVALTDSYPGVPTFGDISAANLNQLSNATDWVMRYMGLRHQPIFCALLREKGPFGPKGVEAGQTTVTWYGSIRRTSEHVALKVNIGVVVLYAGYTETVTLKVNGATAATYNVPSTVGEVAYTTLSATLATTVDAIVDIEVQMLRTAPNPELDTPLVNRLTIYRVYLERSSAPSPAALAPSDARESLTFSALQTRLNAYATALTAIKSRLDANPDIWARQRPFRRRHAFDDFQNEYFEAGRVAVQLHREGQALIVAGRSVRLEYGSFVFEEPTDDGGIYPIKGLLAETLIDASDDGPTASLHYLDSVDGLSPGVGYHVRGVDLRYAAEQLLVTQYGA